MSTPKDFYDLFFEISNEIRHSILLLINEKGMRITDITKKLELNNPEARRHISRLVDVELIVRDVDGFYHITPYGETCILLFQEFIFLSSNNKYFKEHTLSEIPPRFVKRIGEFSIHHKLEDALDFIRHTENLFKESEKYVWIMVDKFPMSSLSTIVEALERGVEFRIIEPKERTFNPDIDVMTSEETRALSRTRHTPLVEQRIVDEIDVCMFLNEKRCIVAFPSTNKQYDYSGFSAISEDSLNWSKELYQHYWKKARSRKSTAEVRELQHNILVEEETDQVIVTGRDMVEHDAQTIQDAVDNYKEVTLKGTFNLGTSTVQISRSVSIKGEGREENVPFTKVYKSGWTYPFYNTPGVSLHQNRLFQIDGKNIDVTIENIHFTDFEYICLDAQNGNSLTIRDSRITLQTGLGRGKSTPTGNQVIGIMQYGGFPGGVLIKGNYLDFTESYGPLTRYARSYDRAENPNYRPDLTKHDCYLGIGISIFDAIGEVLIENNIVRNTNARGIAAADNTESAKVIIRNNEVVTEIYGSYYSVPCFAGIGIKATSGWHVGPGPQVEITDNTIRCDKVNYCGIGITGPELGPAGAEKLKHGLIRGNRVHLENGSVGVFVESCEGYEISDNVLTGKAYYGIGLFPGVDDNRSELGAQGNEIAYNNMSGLSIKTPDEYIKCLLDEGRYTGSKVGSVTSHVWLNINTKENMVKTTINETVIDEGKDNKIEFN